jgi:CRISPR-associated endonuclease/helicase Cas3
MAGRQSCLFNRVRQVVPKNTSAVAIKYRIDEQSVVFGRCSDMFRPVFLIQENTLHDIQFSALSLAARSLWAKSGLENRHGLLAHLLDVAAVVETLLEREPESTRLWAARQFGVPPEQSARWMATLAGLHDFGKGIPGFQAKWTEGKQTDEQVGLRFPSLACEMDRHDLATANLLRAPLQEIVNGEMGWVCHIVQAISAHHGYHFVSAEVNKGRPIQEPGEWREARQEILQIYWQILKPQGTPTLDELTLPAVNWLAGLTSAADWIASNQAFFPPGERHDVLLTYYNDAKHLANKALDKIRWTRAGVLLHEAESTDALLARITERDNLSPRPLQRIGDQLLQQAQGSSLLLVEAPMGEGKTELAFLAHLRLQAANKHRGLYMALPTQATGNAMFKRALTFLESFMNGHADIQLVHGGAAMNEDVQHLHDINHDEVESRSASLWFSQRRRPLLSPYGVGTVDQALLSILNVKHHFVRLWGLANRVVVLDEVHAYDTYTSGLIVMLLRWLKALGCSVVLMSATLPRARRDELLKAWGVDVASIPDLAYPRVMLADESGIHCKPFEARQLASIHLFALGESLDELADKALELLAEGGCGAIIVNTVERAQKLYQDLRKRLSGDAQLLLMHARFPMDERAEREKRGLQWFGLKGERPGKALLVATQVAEQSLDIDFDFMLSDLAPVDLLLQRAGRLHRHDVRERPAQHAQARLWVAGLQQDRLPELKQTAWGYVYDAYILGRTWALLGKESVLQLPRDIDRLVQAVYDHDELPEDVESVARDCIEGEFLGEYLAQVQKERRESQHIVIDLDIEPGNAYDNKRRGREEGEGGFGLENKTRLGRESVTLIPVEIDDDGWHVQKGDVPFAPGKPDSAAIRQLYARQIQVSRVAVVKHFSSSEQAGTIFETALLQNTKPLPMHNGIYHLGKLQLRLDAELGLVYESVDDQTSGNDE